MTELLLDTCALLWLANGEEMTPESRVEVASRNLHVSPISAWEIANLVRKKRLAITVPVVRWFRHATDKMSAAMPQLTVEVLSHSCELPGHPPDDPADRIIIATAREQDMTIVTRDRQILGYSAAGHVRAMAC